MYKMNYPENDVDIYARRRGAVMRYTRIARQNRNIYIYIYGYIYMDIYIHKYIYIYTIN